MRAFKAIALTAIVGAILVEILKIIFAPVSLWLIGVLGAALALLLKALLIAGIVLLSVVAFAVAVYIYRRSKRSDADA